MTLLLEPKRSQTPRRDTGVVEVSVVCQLALQLLLILISSGQTFLNSLYVYIHVYLLSPK